MAEHVREQRMIVAEPLAAYRDCLVEGTRRVVEVALLPQCLCQVVESDRDVTLVAR